MIFKKYSEIENTYRVDYIQKIRDAHFDASNITYGCFTKIDGSNFSMILDENDNFICGKRTSILNNDEISKFSRADVVIENMGMPTLLKNIKKYIKTNFNEIDFIQSDSENFILHLYGELCGGMYRHKDVDSIKTAVKIQGRVSYHPNNIWICFDGYIADPTQKRIFYFDVDQLKNICSTFKIPYQIEKFRGTLDECLNYPNDFIDDTGNKLFGLPLIEDNITEGIVIKPIKPIWFNNGERIILKNKNEKFKERKKVNPNNIKDEKILNEKEKEVLTRLYECITIQRFMSVISKELPTSDKVFGKILGLYMKDIQNEVLKENKEFNLWIETNEIDFKQITKIVQKNIVEFIKPLFFEYLVSIKA